MIRYLEIYCGDNAFSISSRVDELYYGIQENGLDMAFSSFFTGTGRFLDLPRKFELLDVISRMKFATWKSTAKGKTVRMKVR